MKTISLSIAAIGLATALGAHAAPGAALPTVRGRLLGDPAPTADATRTIVIQPDTKYVNVVQDEVVKFVTDKQQFAIKFDGESDTPFNLERIAPADALDHAVIVYVEPDENLR